MTPTVLSVFGVETQQIGGIESYAREVSSQLGRHGWDSILCFHNDAPSNVRRYLEAPNVTVGVLHNACELKWAPIREMARLIRDRHPRILHLHYIGFLGGYPWLARLCSVNQVFLTDHGSRPEGHVIPCASIQPYGACQGYGDDCDEEGDDELLHLLLDGAVGRQQHQRGQERGEQHQPQRDAVDPDLEVDAESLDPALVGDELKPGLVGIEAMMQGKPVIAFDCGGVRDWLQHGKTGFLVPHLDIRQYAYCLDQLIMDDGLRQVMGVEAQECALERFTPDAHINGLLDIYTEVVNEGSADRPFRCAEISDAQRRTGVSL